MKPSPNSIGNGKPTMVIHGRTVHPVDMVSDKAARADKKIRKINPSWYKVYSRFKDIGDIDIYNYYKDMLPKGISKQLFRQWINPKTSTIRFKISTKKKADYWTPDVISSFDKIRRGKYKTKK